jgi:hypothetical protein
MKKSVLYLLSLFCAAVFLLFLSVPFLKGQEAGKSSPALADSVKKIVLVSCVPCHTDKGGLMSRSKVNFTNWAEYSPARQKEKAELICSMLAKEKMPPKEARQKKPELIPTKEQIAVINNWAKALKSK